MSYFLAPEALQPGQQVRLAGEEARHVQSARRIRPGETVALQGPDGMRFSCTVLELGRRDLLLRVGNPVTPPPMPDTRVVLLQAAVKDKAADFIVQKCTELGVAALWFFSAERSTVAHKLLGSPQQLLRWERMAWEACKQSDRQHPPELGVLPDCEAALSHAAGPARWVLDAAGEAGVVPQPAADSDGSVTLLVGPEGGWSVAELEDAQDRGWQSLALGRIVLRAETAALAAVSLTLFGGVSR